MVSSRSLALRALVALQRGRADRLQKELDGKGLDGRDLAFAYELSHGVLRRERLLDFVLAGHAHRGLPKDPLLLVALRLGAYQLLFVPGMKAHAAVHETVELLRSNKGFANAMLRHIQKAINSTVPDPTGHALTAGDPASPTTEVVLGPTRTLRLPKPLPADEIERLAILHSLPDWLAARFCEQHGIEGLRAIAAAASTKPGIFLRSRHGVERASLRAELAAAGVDTEACEHPRLLRWTSGESPFGTPPFVAGQFVVQDPTALLAVEAMPCKAGDTVVDLCAAPGTKTTWLAERVQPGGRVHAFDPDEARRAHIVDNVERLRLVESVSIVDDVALLPSADCVLADVPCSNSGVLGRRVEARRRLIAATFAELAGLQRELLARAIKLSKPGGTVVYATCSIDREENDEVVAAVLADAQLGSCSLVRKQLTLPQAAVHDGGFFAELRRA